MDPSAQHAEVTRSQKSKFGILVQRLSAIDRIVSAQEFAWMGIILYDTVASINTKYSRWAKANAKGLNTALHLTFGKDLSFCFPNTVLKVGEPIVLDPPQQKQRGLLTAVPRFSVNPVSC